MSIRVFIPIVFVAFAASQIYWIERAYALAKRILPARRLRVLAFAAVLAVYAGIFAFNFGAFERRPSAVRLTLTDALLVAPFTCWVLCSLIAFLIAILIRLLRGLARIAPPVSPARRQFLEHAATAAIAAPFVAGAYGLFYTRLNLEITHTRIRLSRLPRAFEGFRIAQLSDIHIGPFMTEEQIRKFAAIANALKPDLIVLTGDFVIMDASVQEAAVRALSGLKAPFGVFGSLGNHENWTGVEGSITLLFRQAGIRILRYARAPITAQGEILNLIGVDYEGGRRDRSYLARVDQLVALDGVNILLSHNPNTFDRAVELGIDLSLAGHTHGGQVALDFISPRVAISSLVTPYVRGWFEKGCGQLYVNRGIGTIGVPIRFDARPEISVFELARA